MSITKISIAFAAVGVSTGLGTLITNSLDTYITGNNTNYALTKVDNKLAFKKTSNQASSHLISSRSDTNEQVYIPDVGVVCEKKEATGQTLLFPNKHTSESCRAITALDLADLREISEKAGAPEPIDVKFVPMVSKTLERRANSSVSSFKP